MTALEDRLGDLLDKALTALENPNLSARERAEVAQRIRDTPMPQRD